MLVFAGSCDEDGAREREFISALRARRVDGIIVVPAGRDHSYLLPELRVGTAIVFVDRPPRFLDADSVTSDDQGGTLHGGVPSRRAGPPAHRIPRCRSRDRDGRGTPPWVSRRPGRSRARPPTRPSFVRAFGLSKTRSDCVTEFFTDGEAPTALLSAQNYFTIGAYKALRSQGLQRQVALVGFGDFPLAEMLDPPVTVSRTIPRARPHRGAALFRRLDGDRSASEHIVCPVHLVPRGSGEIGPMAAR